MHLDYFMHLKYVKFLVRFISLLTFHANCRAISVHLQTLECRHSKNEHKTHMHIRIKEMLINIVVGHFSGFLKLCIYIISENYTVV